ncbi:Hint domain-containing protein [Pseudooceanicola marinus]|uniref:Hint domain-containing protein n=1 Tax=Pseudooceanicola marinus TaxID=396013 RepID=UPI001CD45601|nr:Hint domain-containing protein [Pseudooceanicola marinus]MCA1335632.1 Hint domain-containing protein [Pseudooceanicola marinus]
MGWVAVSCPGVGAIAASGPDTPAGRGTGTLLRSAGPAELMGQGSILLEAQITATRVLNPLLDITFRHPVAGRLTLSQVPGGALSLVLERGSKVRQCSLTLDSGERPERIRAMLSWESRSGVARLVVERPERDVAPLATGFADPVALPFQALTEAALYPELEMLGAGVDFLAVSDGIEPIGPMPGLQGDTLIDTPEGRRAVRELRRGDLVLIEGEGAVPVLAAVRRTLPARGLFRPVQLFAPHFGLTRDVVVAAGQRLVTGGEEVRYLFHSESVLVAAQHLVTDQTGAWAETGPLVTMHQLLLPDQQVLGVCGAQMESLHVGRLRRSAALVEASLLAGYQRSRLPHQPGHARPVLRDYEAKILANHRAA